ncbi:ATP-binding protein [Streptomyces sp. NPDC020917]|uniref:ATP-binding protein n=1 Tax=Streptomyces sp. NPDC020917 TaxID=3365102 RepID=UPI0037A4DF70
MPVTKTTSPTGHPGYSETLKCTSESTEAARRLVRTALATWDLEALVDDAVLIVSELVTNAVRHTPSLLIRVSITRSAPGLVRIDVVDRSQRPPLRRRTDEYSENGRGLTLVDRLTAHWGSDPLPFGKRVWAVLAEESGA